MERTLPHNIEAEQGVLGSIIIDPDAVSLVESFLHADDFYRDAHRTLYEAIIHLYLRREPADFLTICNELERCDKLAAQAWNQRTTSARHSADDRPLQAGTGETGARTRMGGAL